jgi:hypothetical protein
MPVLIYDVRPRQLTIEVSPLSTPINTMPAAALQGLAETLPYQQDYTNVLLPGETITAITSSLNDTTNGANTPDVGRPSDPTDRCCHSADRPRRRADRWPYVPPGDRSDGCGERESMGCVY